MERELPVILAVDFGPLAVSFQAFDPRHQYTQPAPPAQSCRLTSVDGLSRAHPSAAGQSLSSWITLALSVFWLFTVAIHARVRAKEACAESASFI